MFNNFTSYRHVVGCFIALGFAGFFQIALAQDPTPEVAPPPAEAPTATDPKPATPPDSGKPDPAALKSFKDIIKGSKESKGFFTLHQKEEKVWLEIRPEQFDKPFFFTVNVTNSIGERGFYGSYMRNSYIAVFHKIGNHAQLLAKNTRFTAAPNTPQALAVSQAFSDSLLAGAAIVSKPNPDGNGILIDASTLLFSDIPNYSSALERVFRIPYALESRNTSFSDVRADENLTGLHVNAHFFAPKIPLPPLTPTALPVASPVNTTPDPRSFFVGFYYSFSALPDKPMHARKADDRIGHFVTTHYDYTEDLAPKTTRHYVNRWRLDKKNPEAVLSEPVQPIVYWLDKNIPEKYRKSITEGVLEWNKAFERIGYKDAIVVKQQLGNDDFDTIDARHTSIRWYIGVDATPAFGPSQVDSRTGEILDASIAMPEVFGREVRRIFVEQLASTHIDNEADSELVGIGSRREIVGIPENRALCHYASEAGQEMNFASDLLEMRGEIEPDSPAAEALAQAYVKSVIMHEVGHTLGLGHNFRASSVYSLKQIQSPEFTKKNGLAGSVMDYIPFNLAVNGASQGEYVMSTLGPYDYWAIEYAYKPLDEKNEDAELARIAARSNEPQLAYGADEDAYGDISDPDVGTFDLGSDPLEYFKKSVVLSHELWDRVQAKQLKQGETYDSLHRNISMGFYHLAVAVPAALKYVGGTTVLRDHAGSGRVPFAPIPAARQREALSLVTATLFKSDSFRFSPDLVSRLGSDRLDNHARPDVSISTAVLKLQTIALNQLMSDSVALHLLDSAEKVDDKKKVLTLPELYDTVQSAVWSELASGQEISSGRRDLQREHLKHVVNDLVRSSPTTPADARSLQRQNAVALQAHIRIALSHPSTRETKAHLEESLETLSEALRAPILRTGT
jgi:hypothetical protein